MKAIGLIENDVAIGHDGYLFLAGGSHPILQKASENGGIDLTALKTFQENIRHRRDFNEQKGIKFLHVIMPDKQSIIPEKWPLGATPQTGQLFKDMMGELQDHIFYPAEMLAQDYAKTVSKTDTHLTDHGSVIVAAKLVELLTGFDPRNELLDLIKSITIPTEKFGDLGSKLEPPLSAVELTSAARSPGPWLHNDLVGGNNGIIDLRFFAQAPCPNRLVFFGDSFGRELARFLQHWFREVFFFRTAYMHPDIIDLCCPDLVITENVERYMDNVPPDFERPFFFLYPYIKGVPYSPSKEFAEALSGVLSYPRQPHAQFIKKIFG